MKAKNIAEIKNGKGIVFPVGTEFTLTYSMRVRPSLVECVSEAGRILIYCKNMHKYFSGFRKEPSALALEKMMMERGRSIRGKECDPDACDEDGFPCWLVCLGLI